MAAQNPNLAAIALQMALAQEMMNSNVSSSRLPLCCAMLMIAHSYINKDKIMHSKIQSQSIIYE